MPLARSMRRLFPLLGMLMLYATPGLAQFPEHRLLSIYPNGGQAGENVELTVTGTDLEGVDGLRFDHPGLRGFQIKGPAFRVAIAPGTPEGPHEVRLQGRLGISNPRTFFVGSRSEVHEIEPNNTPAAANPVAPGTVVNGRLEASPDVDCFAFDGKHAQRVRINLSAGRLDSPLSATLRVFDLSGRELATSASEAERDPVLEAILPADGRYVIEVHDVVYAGSPAHSYRLTIDDAPRLVALSPLAATPGVETTFTLFGRGLGGEVAQSGQVDGAPIESKSLTWTPPAEASNALGIDPLGVSEAGRRGWLTPAEWFGPVANRLFIAEAKAPVSLESEPNGFESPQVVSPPCDVSATFGIEGDVDVYQFAAKKGAVWLIEALAERNGSLADPGFVIQKVNEKGEAQELIAAQDLNGTVPGFADADRSDDTWLRWQAPEDGTYRVVASDLYGSQRGDLRLTYRLVIRPERPDFHLFVMAPTDAAMNPSGVTLRAGGRASVQILTQRVDGFTGPIQVEAIDLPDGVTAAPCVIGTGLMQTNLIFTAADSALDGEFTPRFIGRMLSGDRKAVLNYEAGKNQVVAEQVHEAIPMTLVRPPVNAGVSKTPEVRATREFVVAVRRDSPFLLTAVPAEAVVAPGETIDITVSVARHAGFAEAVAVSTVDLPPNLPAISGSIAKEATSTTLKLAIPGNVAPGNYTILVQGSGPFPFNKDPNAKDKPNVTVSAPSNPILLTVRRP